MSIAGKTVFAFRMRAWKRAVLQAYFPDTSFQFAPFYLTEDEFAATWEPRILATDRSAIFLWGLQGADHFLRFSREHDVPIHFIEDGFLRSLVATGSRSAPFSITKDGQTSYFDSRSASDLEDILATYDFGADADLMARASAGIERLLRTRISKYNGAAKADALRTDKGRKRILVVGQVEEDASILFGCDRPMSNNDLVRVAAEENPGCDILYRPHPDVLNRVRPAGSDPAEVAHICSIVTAPIPLADMFESVDHVYTITSLAGFEALLRGLSVTCLGLPFYAGWGLTDDRQAHPRRSRSLTVEQVFAAAYLLYPLYFNPVTGEVSSFEECLDLMVRWRGEGMPADVVAAAEARSVAPTFSWSGPYGLASWRLALTPFLTPVVGLIGDSKDRQRFRADPITFFRELSNPAYRRIGKILYPHDPD